METLHPKLKYVLDHFLPTYQEGYIPSLEEIRARNVLGTFENVETVHEVTNRVIDGLAGEIPLRIYKPEGEGLFPIIVFFHGGGFVYGNLDSHDGVCRSIVNVAEQVLVAVDYRLAPEHPFPAAPEDCYAATKWVFEHAEELKGDRLKLSVVGDSAGGNLSAVVSIMAKERKEFTIAKQVLLYPVTDYCQPNSYASYHKYGRGYFLTNEIMALFKSLYVPKQEDKSNYYHAPLHAPDLTDLPPAFVITAEFDPLRDEGELYAKKLEESGVPVVLRREEGLIHGFFNLFGIMDSKDDIKEVYEAIATFLNSERVRT
ncbi:MULTISPECIES: alpha/beta hydrolase [Bacillus]|uniref:alpha/beta hydrolase n=1 Tax=Bacillus TaxID=1386 RepID=UPI00031C9C6E|nr:MULTISPECIES: alpha/beta hydrolase [Bacillus]